jgi:hypothetical protein
MNKYTLSPQELDGLSDLIAQTIEKAAMTEVPELEYAYRIYLNPQTRKLATAWAQCHRGYATGLEDKGYVYLCEISPFGSELFDGVDADPAGSRPEDIMEEVELRLNDLATGLQ